MTKESGRKSIEQKVQDFEKNAVVLKKKGHGETNIRTNYIDVLFEALGWNMKSHYDVIREFSQKDTSGTKKVDYAFKINGKLKFFVEAKEASIDLINDKDSIYQAKRYAYSTSGKAPIVILTDFEEFRVFNVLKAPDYNNTDRELLKRHCLKYSDYINNWDLLWDTFSKEAVSNGSLEILRGKIDKNAKLMDADFLEQITGWREDLARNIALRNKDLKVDEINEAVQRILDRLLFIRNLEDREIEPENTLLDKTKNSENIYQSIIPVFNKLDNVYNGLLFKKHFSEELNVDDKTIKDIIKSLCYPVSPFQFDVIEPEILGRIYEKFLGSKIRLTENHQAKIEEKIEVRKAGGVYYTPEYIVNYIVENTVGKKIEGLNPEEIKKIKIVDPACGSGSFLLGAYSYILAYHEKWYLSHKSDKLYKNDYYVSKDGELKVNLDKRGDILKNNIFGVDIDKEATEVAIMSLYLKMLDDGFDKGERDLFFIKGHVLPDMSNNIKCGNSLISFDYFEGRIDFDKNEWKQINPFHWTNEFPEVFDKGGFDCVIGNPPYGAWFEESEDMYLSNKFSVFSNVKDIYLAFIQNSFFLLKDDGTFSYIIPSAWTGGPRYEKLRSLLLIYNINLLILLPFDVFADAYIDTLILKVTNRKVISDSIIQTYEYPKKEKLISINIEKYNSIDQSKWLASESKKFVIHTEALRIIEAIYTRKHSKFSDVIQMKRGVLFDKTLLVDSKKTQNYFKYFEGDVYRYELNLKLTNWVEFGDNMKEKPKEIYWFTSNRILLRRLVNRQQRLMAMITSDEFITNKNLYSIIINKDSLIDLKIVLAILNSKLISFLYLKQITQATKDDFPQVTVKDILSLPFPDYDKFLKKQNSVIAFVDKLCNLKIEKKNVKTEHDDKLLTSQIEMIEKQIDIAIYDMYGLSDEEIKIVEGE